MITCETAWVDRQNEAQVTLASNLIVIENMKNMSFMKNISLVIRMFINEMESLPLYKQAS